MSDSIDSRISDFESKPKLVKVRTIVMAEAYEEQLEAEKELLNLFSGKHGRHILEGVIGPVAIFKNSAKDYSTYPYTAAYLNTNEFPAWQLTHSYWPVVELAILDAIGHRHEGLNNRFAQYAGAMVGLTINEEAL